MKLKITQTAIVSVPFGTELTLQKDGAVVPGGHLIQSRLALLPTSAKTLNQLGCVQLDQTATYELELEPGEEEPA